MFIIIKIHFDLFLLSFFLGCLAQQWRMFVFNQKNPTKDHAGDHKRKLNKITSNNIDDTQQRT